MGKNFKTSDLISDRYIRSIKKLYERSDKPWKGLVKGSPNKSIMTHAYRIFIRSKPETYLDYGCGLEESHKNKNQLIRIMEKFSRISNDRVKENDDYEDAKDPDLKWINDIIMTDYDPAVKKYSKLPIGKFDFVSVLHVLEFVEESKLKNVLGHIRSITTERAAFLITTSNGKEKPNNNQPPYITLQMPKKWVRLIQDDWRVEHMITHGFLTMIVATPRTPKPMRLPKKDNHFPRNTDRYQYDVFARSLKHIPGLNNKSGAFERGYKKKGVAIDVGAHVGFYARALEESFDRVICFEPAIENYECLVENVPNAIHYNLAAGEFFGEIGLKIYDDNSGNNFPRLSVPKSDEKDIKKVKVVPIDAFEFSDVNFIKIDVQGFEEQVLRGAKETILKHNPIILVELELPFSRKMNNGAIEFLEEVLEYVELEKLGKDCIYGPLKGVIGGELTRLASKNRNIRPTRRTGTTLTLDYRTARNSRPFRASYDNNFIIVDRVKIDGEIEKILEKELKVGKDSINCYYIPDKLFSKYVMLKFQKGASANLISVKGLSKPHEGLSVAFGRQCIEPIIKNSLHNKKDLIYIDHAYFDRGYRGKGRVPEKPPNFRIIVNGLHPNKIIDRPFDRLDIFDIHSKTWKKNGSHILVCPPTDYFWNVTGIDGSTWLDDTIKKIRNNSDRLIVLRPKPGFLNKFHIDISKKYKNIELCESTKIRPIPIEVNLVDCWATVAPASAVSIDAALLGIPSFCEPYGPTASISCSDFSKIESPVYGDREALFKHLSYCQFSTNEIGNGLAWEIIREILLSGLYKYE